MKKKSSLFGDLISHALLMIATVIAIFPLIWIFISSVKSKGELTSEPTRFWPKIFTLDYFEHVINDLNFIVNIKNSLFISLVTTLIAITISEMAA